MDFQALPLFKKKIVVQYFLYLKKIDPHLNDIFTLQ